MSLVLTNRRPPGSASVAAPRRTTGWTPRPVSHRRHLVEPALVATAAVGAAVVLAWWWATTSVQGLPGWVTGAGRLSGLLAGYLMAVVLLLMARVPLLERSVGADRLARWHAASGRYTISLLVAHVAAITVGYALTTRADLLVQARVLLVDYPDVLLAAVGTSLLIGVGVVSARAARRRLRYETWYAVHLLTYLAIALSFLHVLSNGQQFVTHPVARALWIALYAAAGAAVAYYRVALPLRQAVRQQLRVERVHREGPGVVSLVLAGPQVPELKVAPGQFLRLRFLTRGYGWTAHPFSLSAAPHGQRLRVTVKALGDHTGRLPALRPGTRVLVEGPYGALTAARRTQSKVLLLAGGIGVTPLRALFQTLPANPGELTLVYRARQHDDVILRRELDALATRRSQQVHYAIGPSGGPGDVLVGDRLARLLPDLAEHDVYLCGPPGFVDTAMQVLRRNRVPRRRIHIESFEL